MPAGIESCRKPAVFEKTSTRRSSTCACALAQKYPITTAVTATSKWPKPLIPTSSSSNEQFVVSPSKLRFVLSFVKICSSLQRYCRTV